MSHPLTLSKTIKNWDAGLSLCQICKTNIKHVGFILITKYKKHVFQSKS